MKRPPSSLRAAVAGVHTVFVCVALLAAAAGDQPDVSAVVGALLCLPSGLNVTGAGGEPLPSWMHAHAHTRDVCGVPSVTDAGQHFLSVRRAGGPDDVFAVSVVEPPPARCPTVTAHARMHAASAPAASIATVRVQVVAAISYAVGVANSSVTLTALDAVSGAPLASTHACEVVCCGCVGGCGSMHVLGSHFCFL